MLQATEAQTIRTPQPAAKPVAAKAPAEAGLSFGDDKVVLRGAKKPVEASPAPGLLTGMIESAKAVAAKFGTAVSDAIAGLTGLLSGYYAANIIANWSREIQDVDAPNEAGNRRRRVEARRQEAYAASQALTQRTTDSIALTQRAAETTQTVRR